MDSIGANWYTVLWVTMENHELHVRMDGAMGKIGTGLQELICNFIQ